MSSIIRSLAAMLLATLLGSVSLAQEVVENPQYQAWAKFKPGTWVIFSHEMQMGDQSRKEPRRIKSKLVSVTAEQVVLEGSSVNAEGSPATDERTIPARVKREAITQPWKMPPEAGEKKMLPDQEVAIGEKRYKCKVFNYNFEQNGTRFDDTFWTCADLPGEVVKLEQHLTGRMNGTTKIEMTQVGVTP